MKVLINVADERVTTVGCLRCGQLAVLPCGDVILGVYGGGIVNLNTQSIALYSNMQDSNRDMPIKLLPAGTQVILEAD